MYQRFNNHSFPAGNPIANALVVIAGVVVIGLSLVVGFVMFVVLGSLLLVLGAIIGIRIWWLNRRLQKQAGQPGAATQHYESIEVIEGEFRDVSGSKSGSRRRRD
ncbi:MAG: hypothetical protein U5K38_04975 [Woeseiaceae bacterium]|nr:hypothetical protein [Woeseiaceae bacterium]